MASSAVDRPTLTDDTGTPASPNADGDLVDAAFINDMYDRIDDLLSRSETIMQLVSGEGFGTHNFTGGGSTEHQIRVRNTTSATGALARLNLGNDAADLVAALEALSSGFTTAAGRVADGVALRALRSGGLSLIAEHASGDIRGYANGTTKFFTFNGDVFALTAPAAGAYALGGVLDASVNTTTVGTDGNVTQKDLHTFSLPASVLAIDGQSIEFRCHGEFGANNDTKTVRLFFGAQELVSHGPSTDSNGQYWEAWCRVYRTGAATQRAIGAVTHGVNGADRLGGQRTHSTPTETLSGAITVKVTGQNGVATANDIQCYASELIYHP